MLLRMENGNSPKPNQTGSLTVTATYAYDNLHRLTDKTFSDGTQNSSHVYDAATFWGVTIENPKGRRIASTAASGSLGSIVSYDVMGRPKKTWECPPSGCAVTESGYNLDGSMAWVKYPSGRKVTFGYDAAARQAAVTFADFNGTAVNYPYYNSTAFHPSGPVQNWTLGNGNVESLGLNNRLQLSTSTMNEGSTPRIDRNYSYGSSNNGNIFSIADNLDATRNQTFTYDQMNRIKTAYEGASYGAGRWAQTFAIDPWGNLQQSGTQAFQVPADSNNRLYDSAHPSWYTYDSAGNMTGFNDGVTGQKYYTYDGESRITTTGGYSYTYDANGMRVRKYQTASPNNWTEYIYFGSNVIAEKDQAGVWTDYIFAGGKRIAKAPGVIATTGTEYYHSDHLGSARLMTNASGGVVTNSIATMLPYGQQYEAATNDNHYKFTGKERDTESNLDYFGARYYGSTMGRFLTPDPLLNSGQPWNPQSWNRYTYVENNPVKYIDPTGLYKWSKNCDEGADSSCKAERDRFRQSLENLKKAAEGLEKGSEERKAMEKVLSRYGEEGKGNLKVAFGDAGGNLAVAEGSTVTFDYDQIDKSASNSQMRTDDLDTGVTGHEGEHFRILFGVVMTPPKLGTERQALTVESFVFQGLGVKDTAFRLWDPAWAKVDKATQQVFRKEAVDRELARQAELNKGEKK
jgi:RHS repeat-associated protein